MAKTVPEPIAGRGQNLNSGKPQLALSQFDHALNNRDMRLMEHNWDASEEAAMDNPLGGIERGWNEIRTVYDRPVRKCEPV